MISNKIILEILKENIQLFDSFIGVYVFGSVLCSDTIYHDLDILLIYDDYSSEISLSEKTIVTNLEMVCHVPIDLIALSTEELQETGFLEKISNYVKVK